MKLITAPNAPCMSHSIEKTNKQTTHTHTHTRQLRQHQLNTVTQVEKNAHKRVTHIYRYEKKKSFLHSAKSKQPTKISSKQNGG